MRPEDVRGPTHDPSPAPPTYLSPPDAILCLLRGTASRRRAEDGVRYERPAHGGNSGSATRPRA
eukprot:522358-Lingulodinium_polyedra.AAC.1